MTEAEGDSMKKKYAGLDIAKFLCALVVLFYHFFSEHGPIPALLEDMLSLYAVCVALFMVISGFLLNDKLLVETEERVRRLIVKRQVLRILKIYLLWSVPYIVYSIARWDFSSVTPLFVIGKIQSWVFGSTFATIWFMPSLAIGMLLSYFAVEKLPSWLVAVLAVCAYAIGSMNLTYSFVIRDYSWYAEIHQFIERWLNGPRGQFLFGFPMVTLGYVIARTKSRYKPVSSGIISLVLMAGLLAEALILRKLIGHTGIDLLVLMPPATIFITSFLISLPIPWFGGCVWMRKMSVLIFMSQRLFLTVLPGIIVSVRPLYQNRFASFMIVCGGTFLLSEAVILISKRVEWMKQLY